jgi:hypothetical protein
LLQTIWSGEAGEQMKKVFIFLVIIIGSVSAQAQKVRVGSDRNVDLAKYKTYFLEKIPAQNPIVGQTIASAIEAALTAKGLTKVEKDPDITVVVWTATDSNLQISNPSWSTAMGSAASTGMGGRSQSWPVTQGSLIVDIADAGTKQSVWRAEATHTLEHGPTGDRAKDAKSVEKPIRKAVEKMFKQFPHPNQN